MALVSRLCMALSGKALYPLSVTRKSSLLHTTSSFKTRVLPVLEEDITFDEFGNPVMNGTTAKNIEIAARALQENETVGFPTETVYGLAANALNDDAVLRIYAAKNRPADNPLIVHIASREQLEKQILNTTETGLQIPAIYNDLIEKYWPGPLTILLPLPTSLHTVSPVCTMGQKTVGVRLPSNPIARALISKADVPLAAPSANASTRPSPTLAEHVLADLDSRIPYILDGGPCDVGLESTVVDGLVDPPQVLRPGGISIEQIRAVGGNAWKNVIYAKPTANENEHVRTPGMKYRHYSPRSPVILVEYGSKDYSLRLEQCLRKISERASLTVGLLSVTAGVGDALKIIPELTVKTFPLGISPREVSHELFRQIRSADMQNVDAIIIEGVPEYDEGRAIMNRVRKAASIII